MRHKRELALVLAAALIVTLGCNPFARRSRYKGPPVAGEYTVAVVDATTGLGIEGAIVEWDYYFLSDWVDAAQRRSMGVKATGRDGNAYIPQERRGGDDHFQELTVWVTVAGYHKAQKVVKETSGVITFQMQPISPSGAVPMPKKK